MADFRQAIGLLFFLAALLTLAAPARAATICTLVIEAATGATVHETGDCDRRVTPASTFKIPLAVMGFDSGVLTGPYAPTLPFVQGYPDWIAAWRQDTDPARWMRESVVWYSQQITKRLGIERFAAYVRAFNYGNADVGGDPGQDNALERAWLTSSLLISPREQTAFLRALIDRTLPARSAAIDNTLLIVESRALPDGWTLWGKTGSAYPRRADGSFDRGRGWGWYVGWALREGRLLVFARLSQADGPGEVSGGVNTRDRLLADWPSLIQ